MLSTSLLTDFAHEFFGYGNLAAPIWFVGMEEGGGNSEAEIAARLTKWDAHDTPATPWLAESVSVVDRRTNLEDFFDIARSWARQLEPQRTTCHG